VGRDDSSHIMSEFKGARYKRLESHHREVFGAVEAGAIDFDARIAQGGCVFDAINTGWVLSDLRWGEGGPRVGFRPIYVFLRAGHHPARTHR